MKVLYIDTPNGISGDMFLSGLLDLGLPEEILRQKLGSLGVDGWDLIISRTQKRGIDSTTITVNTGEVHPHRNLDDINQIIDNSQLANREKELAKTIFLRLATAEAHVHGSSIEHIHFHEVGAVDAIVDICSAAIGICFFEPSKILCSPLPLGSGYVTCAHGKIPVPAPATVELLKGIPVYSNGMIGELVTPTGAAIVSTIADEFGPIPTMEVKDIGYGAGFKDFEIPNVVRLLVGKYDGEANNPLSNNRACLIEFNVDDMNPEILSTVKDRLLAAGALDVWSIPVYMKKGRLGFVVSVLSDPKMVTTLNEMIFRETSTFGIRYIEYERQILDRKWKSVKTQYGEIRVKIGYKDGQLLTASPEFEDCKKAADIYRVPIAEVYEAARASMNKEALG